MWDRELVQDYCSFIIRMKVEKLLITYYFIDQLEELILSETIKYLQIQGDNASLKSICD